MADEFRTTRWTLVLTARGDDTLAGAALEQLCRDVWRPLYAFARRWGCTPEDGYTALAVDTETPERAFERVWAMADARSRAKLGEECAASGKGEVFAAMFPNGGEAPENYAAMGGRQGMSEQALRSLALRLRRRWRELIRAELVRTVSSGEALEEEMAALRAALA